MKKNFLILLGLCALAGLYTLYSDHYSRPAPAPVKALNLSAQEDLVPAPDFAFTDQSGSAYTLSNFHGRPVVLNFWASWCAPCVIEFPAMLKLAAMKTDAVFLFVSLDQSSEDMQRFIGKIDPAMLGANVYIARDADTKISAGLYRTFQLPETYLIDSDGNIARKIFGADIDWTSVDMQATLDNLAQ